MVTMGVRRRRQNRHLGLNQNFLENLKLAAQFRLIDLFLPMKVYQPVWHSHSTRARFTVLVSCSSELAVHSCLLLYVQGQVRVARLAFLRPNFRNLASLQVGWPINCIWSFSGLFLALFVFLLKFSSGKLPNFSADCFTVGLYFVTITWKQIF